MTGPKMRQSWREKEKKECKKVLIIDATDYPLIRVIEPLSPIGISGDDPLDLLEEFHMRLWTFHEFDYE
jgi:hypothetical protein